jgi:hypothetical protein
MKPRILSAIIYASTTVAVALFFDGLYGGEPIRHHLGLIHTASLGACLFAAATLLSLFSVRLGVICGFAWTLLSLPRVGFERGYICIDDGTHCFERVYRLAITTNVIPGGVN